MLALADSLMIGMLSGRKNLGWRAVEPEDLESRLRRDRKVTDPDLRRAREIQEAVDRFDPERRPTLGQVLLYLGILEAGELGEYRAPERSTAGRK